MTNMANMPIYSKNSLNLVFSRTKKAIGFGTWYVGAGMLALPG